ncbi:MAG: hypothetical protein KAT05_04245 [Spirochaetes bacterium]|nr:hypothetical protein [Spirochaetota bacterium]
MKINFLLLSIIIITLFSCKTIEKKNKKINEIIYKYKGFGDDMKKRLRPMILQSKKPINGLVGINKQNCLATINKNGEFSILEIDEGGFISIDPLVYKFPPYEGTSLHSDSEHNIVWQIRGRGFYFFDIKTKRTGHCIASNDGDDKIINSFLVDPKNKIFLIKIRSYYHNGNYYILYDLMKDEIIFTSSIFKGSIYPLNYNNFLFNEVYGENNNLLRWHIIDISFNKLKENKLTKKLTKMQINIWEKTKTIHNGRMMMLGTFWVNDDLVYASIRWDDEFEDIRIEPLVLQKPKGKNISPRFVFSPDGNWVKSLKTVRTGVNFPPELLIYHVGEVYPQGLSLPILCGYTKKINQGGFMNHSLWGPCYVYLDCDFDNKLFVYKLNDGLKILAEQAKDAVVK